MIETLQALLQLGCSFRHVFCRVFCRAGFFCVTCTEVDLINVSCTVFTTFSFVRVRMCHRLLHYYLILWLGPHPRSDVVSAEAQPVADSIPGMHYEEIWVVLEFGT